MLHEKVSFARHCRANDTFFVNCSNPVYPGLTGFEQESKKVSSSWFPAKSVEQLRVEQSQFEQFTPTLPFLNDQKMIHLFVQKCFSSISERPINKTFRFSLMVYLNNYFSSFPERPMNKTIRFSLMVYLNKYFSSFLERARLFRSRWQRERGCRGRSRCCGSFGSCWERFQLPEVQPSCQGSLLNLKV